MSQMLSVFLESRVSREELFSFLQSAGGKLLTGPPEQVVIGRSDGTVWCYDRGNKFNLDEEEQAELKSHGSSWNTEVALELSSEEGSSGLAEELCERIIHEYGTCILYSDDGSFYEPEQLHRAVCGQASYAEPEKDQEMTE